MGSVLGVIVVLILRRNASPNAVIPSPWYVISFCRLYVTKGKRVAMMNKLIFRVKERRERAKFMNKMSDDNRLLRD